MCWDSLLDAVDAVDEHEYEHGCDESGRMMKWPMMVSVVWVLYLGNDVVVVAVGDVVGDDVNDCGDCGDSSGDEVSVSSLQTLVVTGGDTVVVDGDDDIVAEVVVEVEVLDDECDGDDGHDAGGDDCCTCHHVVPVVAVVQVQVELFESWVVLPHDSAVAVAVAVEPSVEPPWPHCSHIDWEWSL